MRSDTHQSSVTSSQFREIGGPGLVVGRHEVNQVGFDGRKSTLGNFSARVSVVARQGAHVGLTVAMSGLFREFLFQLVLKNGAGLSVVGSPSTRRAREGVGRSGEQSGSDGDSRSVGVVSR